MSNKIQQTGEDYPDAAGKHCTDARVLLTGGCSDGAAYLSGYAVECMLKALVQVENGHNRLVRGHDLNRLSWEALNLATLPGGRTFRYLTNISITSISYGLPPNNWNETLRYYPRGTISQTQAASWVADTERLYVEVIGGLLKDGEIIL
jgi:hypothetical protein